MSINTDYKTYLINSIITYILEAEYDSFTEELEQLQYLPDHIYVKAEILKDMIKLKY